MLTLFVPVAKLRKHPLVYQVGATGNWPQQPTPAYNRRKRVKQYATSFDETEDRIQTKTILIQDMTKRSEVLDRVSQYLNEQRLLIFVDGNLG
jgi:hypothetical protein